MLSVIILWAVAVSMAHMTIISVVIEWMMCNVCVTDGSSVQTIARTGCHMTMVCKVTSTETVSMEMTATIGMCIHKKIET